MSHKNEGSSKRFTLFCWFTLGYTIAVVLWGAYVRATGSGAGCGKHWPLCNGEVVPRSGQLETLIEFTHRVTSGIAFILVVILLIWSLKVFPKRNIVRKGASFAMIFMITEALLGAGLVLFGLVADNDSFARAWAMVLHLVNTFLLLAALSVTLWWSREAFPPRLRAPKFPKFLLMTLLVGLIILGASGAIAALGDTLFPDQSLVSALQEDFSPTAHILIRLRVYHPLLAGIVGLLVIFTAFALVRNQYDPPVRNLAITVGLLFLAQLGVGVVNLLLLAPVWLQLVHLLFADLVWISSVLLTTATLGDRRQPHS
jgi:heme A synthase